jgi:hypothetical protein
MFLCLINLPSFPDDGRVALFTLALDGASGQPHDRAGLLPGKESIPQIHWIETIWTLRWTETSLSRSLSLYRHNYLLSKSYSVTYISSIGGIWNAPIYGVCAACLSRMLSGAPVRKKNSHTRCNCVTCKIQFIKVSLNGWMIKNWKRCWIIWRNSDMLYQRLRATVARSV